MVKVIAQFLFKDGVIDEAKALGEELVLATRAEEGCRQYDLLQAADNANLLIILETWASQQALDAHSASAHFTRIVPKLADLCVQPPAVTTVVQLV